MIKTLEDDFQGCYIMKIFGIHEAPGALIPKGLPNIISLTEPVSLGVGTNVCWVSPSVTWTS